MELVEHSEGKTRLLVPSVSLTRDPPPTAPVFFNPAASLNRDVSVAVAAASGSTTFCDSMSGVGARGVRVATEAEGVKEVALVDFNAEALAVGRRNAALNGVEWKCEFSESETSSFLFSRFGRDLRYGFVDLDPFGSPVRQIQGGLTATADGGILSVTATDTAVLCGVHRDVCRRRYGAAPLNNRFHHETGVRILLGALARTGASLDLEATPVASHSTRHYIRVYVRVRTGAAKAERVEESVGYVSWCPRCRTASASDAPAGPCEGCGKEPKVAGPLWVGKLTDDGLVAAAESGAGLLGMRQAAKVLGGLRGVDGFPPWSFGAEEVCSELGVPSVPEEAIREALGRKGFGSMKTPFEKRGLKTTAPYGEFVDAVKAASEATRSRIGRV